MHCNDRDWSALDKITDEQGTAVDDTQAMRRCGGERSNVNNESRRIGFSAGHVPLGVHAAEPGEGYAAADSRHGEAGEESSG